MKTLTTSLNIAQNNLNTEIVNFNTNEQLYQTLMEEFPFGIALYKKGRFIFVNKGFCKITGYNEQELLSFRGREIINIIYYKDRHNLKRFLDSFLGNMKPVQPLYFRILRNDGYICWLELNVTKVRTNNKSVLQLITNDVTEKKMSEEQVLYSQRMETMGQLTAGVAHHLSTPLAVISTRLQMLQDDLKRDGQLKYLPNLNKVMEGSQNISGIITRLVTFLRQSESIKEVTDINMLLKEIICLIKPSAEKKNIKIESVLSVDLPGIPVFRNKLEQVFLNIIINAFDAMPRGGCFLIQSKLVIRSVPNLVICFSDTGTGMQKKEEENIFKPFFTTKSVSKGSGLGMFKSHCFIKEHNGDIFVNSEKGKGTKVVIYLPVRI